MAQPYIRLQNVAKVYDTKGGTVEACVDINLDVRQSEFVAIVGPSGCGKTTILKMVAGLVPYSAGTITVGSNVVDRPQTDVGIVFQDAIMLDWRDVISNVMLQIDIRRMDRTKYRPVAAHLLRQTGLEGFERKKPYELSGGMRQRVSICRALVHDPPLLLMDEPFGALDEINRNKLDADLISLWWQKKLTVVFVTHSIYEAVFLSTRVVVMSARPGRVLKEVAIDEPHPRGDAWRVTQRFAAYAKELSELLAEASAKGTTDL